MKTVLVTLPVEERHKAKLEAAGAGCRFVYCGLNGATPELVQQADIILGCVPAGMIQASPRLGLLQLYSAGTDPYIVPGVLDEHTGWMSIRSSPTPPGPTARPSESTPSPCC